jgi:hypothetical protein
MEDMIDMDFHLQYWQSQFTTPRDIINYIAFCPYDISSVVAEQFQALTVISVGSGYLRILIL